MSDQFYDFHIDAPSQSKSDAGRYDKLREAGKATRFVKGTSGNPRGRSKRPIATSTEALGIFRQTRVQSPGGAR
jgi:Family of unknown function (DUF5681)